MKKYLGLIVALVGIIIVGASVIFTPSHAFNVVDSSNGLNASAGIFFAGLIVFGGGVVMYASAVTPQKVK